MPEEHNFVVRCSKCDSNLFLLKNIYIPDGVSESGLQRCCAGCGELSWIYVGVVLEGTNA